MSARFQKKKKNAENQNRNTFFKLVQKNLEQKELIKIKKFFTY